jgi:para-aminobenzoate synthetase component 1
MQIKGINTSLNSFELYTLFKDHSYSFFLDSGMDQEKLGRYSFIGFDPFMNFKSQGEKITIYKNGRAEESCGNPFARLQEILSLYKMDYETELPFIGGAVGYLGYDLCRHLEDLPNSALDDIQLPDCYFGFYDGVIVVDHLLHEVFLAALGIKQREEDNIAYMEEIIRQGEAKVIKAALPVKPASYIQSNLTKAEYMQAVERIKKYIRAGDIYQANMTQRFCCKVKARPYDIYAKLRDINPAPFSAFIDFQEGHIACSSPERFLKIKGRYIETRPIKGTCPRGKTPEQDNLLAQDLLASEKNRSELLMIVDLERNDLGKIAKTGTVKVTELFHLESYPTVHHLVATIIAEIDQRFDVIDCLKAMFPGGSITGAPKIRAMEIIDELEPTARNIYTGSIGFIGFNGDADLNIAIRTIVCKDQKAYLQVGGGIVWDSVADQEYQETLDKAKAMMEVLLNTPINA